MLGFRNHYSETDRVYLLAHDRRMGMVYIHVEVYRAVDQYLAWGAQPAVWSWAI